MGWTARILAGLALSVAAGGAMACERGCEYRHDHRYAEDRYGPAAGDVRREAYRDPYGHRPAPCRTACGGEISLPGSFFAGAGGVGPIPAGPDYGYVYVVRGGGFAGARSYATASASASASARVSVRVSGGSRSGGCCR